MARKKTAPDKAGSATGSARAKPRFRDFLKQTADGAESEKQDTRSAEKERADDEPNRNAAREFEKLPIGATQAAEATAILQRYKTGKASLDRRIIDNELWFKQAHWKQFGNHMMEGKPQPSSGWLFNSIANKHADAMDSYPEPNVLPRAADDEETARALSSVLPALLDQLDYEQVYSDTWWRKLKQGTGVKGVFWDASAHGGRGDIRIKPMELLMLFWEPGVTDIQDSPHFFSLALENSRTLEHRWPQLRGHTGRTMDIAQYVHDEHIDTADKSLVVDWYYKVETPEGKTLVQYCKFCNGVVLYASENNPLLRERGFYDHGKYPFVFDALFVEPDSPVGFGYIDVMKDCQMSIDRLNQAMDENVLLASKARYLLADNTGVNEQELADLSRDIVHVTGRVTDESFRQIQTQGLQDYSLNYLNNRISELKETSGNRDFAQGSTASGVTAASAIAALQEAGSKLSRDMLKSAYRSFVKECYLCIELMRQFYDDERVFRITGGNGQAEFIRFSGQALRAQPNPMPGSALLHGREPIFDIIVSAAKKSTFSRLSQNETAKECYRLGFFSPENADAALTALEMMDFEGVEKVRESVRRNAVLARNVERMQGEMVKMGAIIDSLWDGRDGTEPHLTRELAAAFGIRAAGSGAARRGAADNARKTRTQSGGNKIQFDSLGGGWQTANSARADRVKQRAANAANPYGVS